MLAVFTSFLLYHHSLLFSRSLPSANRHTAIYVVWTNTYFNRESCLWTLRPSSPTMPLLCSHGWCPRPPSPLTLSPCPLWDVPLLGFHPSPAPAQVLNNLHASKANKQFADLFLATFSASFTQSVTPSILNAFSLSYRTQDSTQYSMWFSFFSTAHSSVYYWDSSPTLKHWGAQVPFLGLPFSSPLLTYKVNTLVLCNRKTPIFKS